MSRILPEVNLRAMEPEDLDILYGIENDTRQGKKKGKFQYFGET